MSNSRAKMTSRYPRKAVSTVGRVIGRKRSRLKM
jgi:hypothetical protein